jgi:lysophospholipase L1-like esterase
MVNRRVWTLLAFIAIATGTARASPSPQPLQLDRAASGDLLLYNAGSGEWLAARFTAAPGEPFIYIAGRWRAGLVILTARLNQDAFSDAVLYDPATGDCAAAYGTDSGFALRAGRLAAGRILYGADLDGDGLDEVIAYDRVSGDALVARSQDAGLAIDRLVLPPRRELIAADFTGDGRADLLTYDPVTGLVRLLSLAPGASTTVFEADWAEGWTIRPAQLHPDARTELFLYHQETGAWIQGRFDAAGTLDLHSGWLPANRASVLADFDGDGLDDILLYDYFEGRWAVFRTLMGAGIGEGASGVWARDARVVASDFNADGRADLLLYDPRDGRFGVALAESGGFAAVAAGSWAGDWLVASRTGDRLNATPWAPSLQAPGGGAPPTFPLPASVTYLTTPRILAFGDSITAGQHSASLTPDGEAVHADYPTRLAELLADRYETQTIRMTGSGVPGEWAESGKNRLGIVLDSVRPDLVLLLEGVNDISGGRTPAQIGADLQTMVNRALVRGVRVLLARLTPVTSNFDPSGATQSAIQNVNTRIDAISSQSGLGPAVNLFGALSGTGMIGGDGLHPTDAGYEQIAQTFFSQITQRFQIIAKPALQ